MSSGLLVFVVTGVLVPLVLTEVGDWCPWAARRVVRWAARRLGDPAACERYEEEWAANLEEVPGKLSRLCSAFGYLACVPRMRRSVRGHRRRARTSLGSTVWAWLRPLDPFRSVTARLGLLSATCVLLSTLMTVVAVQSSTQVRIMLLFSLAAALLIATFTAHGIVSAAHRVTLTARAAASGDYTRRVPVDSRDEIGELAAHFNTMLQHLEAAEADRHGPADEHRRELLACVAQLHETVRQAHPAGTPDVPGRQDVIVRLDRLTSQLDELTRVLTGPQPLEQPEPQP